MPLPGVDGADGQVAGEHRPARRLAALDGLHWQGPVTEVHQISTGTASASGSGSGAGWNATAANGDGGTLAHVVAGVVPGPAMTATPTPAVADPASNSPGRVSAHDRFGSRTRQRWMPWIAYPIWRRSAARSAS